MGGWLRRNAEAVEAVGTLITAIVAVAALFGVLLQLSEADRVARETAARDAYRGHLALAATLPKFATPAPADGDMCRFAFDTSEAGAYQAFVDHLLYAAEQMMDVAEGWEPTFTEQLTPHAAYICAIDYAVLSDDLAVMVNRFRAETCSSVPSCED